MKATSRAYWTLLLLTLVYAVSLVDRSVIGILLDAIKRDMEVTDTVMGLVTGFGFSVIYSLAGIPVGLWADYGNRRNIVAAGLAVFSVATSLTAFAANIYHVLVGRLLLAAGESTQLAPSVSMLADVFPKQSRARAMAFFGAGPSIGIILGLSAAGLLNAHYGWRVTLMLLGIPGLLLAILIRFTMAEPDRTQQGGGASDRKIGPATSLGFLFRQPTFVCMLLATALNAWPLFATTIWGPAFMGRIHGLGSAQTGMLFGLVYGVLGVIGALGGGFLSDLLGGKREQRKLILPAIAAAIVFPAHLVFLLAGSLPVAIVALGVVAFMANAQMGPVWAVMQSVSPIRMRATAAACFQLLLNLLGMGLGPFLVGFLSDKLAAQYGAEALRYAMLLLPVAALGSSALLLLAARHMLVDTERAHQFDSA
ncbi:MAG: MFS transporter [Gammaproteobacteria bacterium]|nr:MFS transporter [Gammaproteobacteria bacterium]